MIKRFFVLSIIVFSLILFSGCGSEAVDAVTPEVTEASAQITAETLVPSPTAPMPTAPISTALMDNTAGISSELDQQIQDFLNKAGEYSDENMKNRIITKDDGAETKLGLINHYDELYLECWLFDFRQQDDYIKLLVGFDGQNNERFVTALAVPLYFYDGDMNFLEYLKLNSNSLSSDLNEDEYLSLYTPGEICKKFGGMKNSPFICSSSLEEFTDFEDYDDASIRFLKECNDKVILVKSLIGEAAMNGAEPGFGASEGRSIIKITSAEDIDKIDIADIPIIGREIYY